MLTISKQTLVINRLSGDVDLELYLKPELQGAQVQTLPLHLEHRHRRKNNGERQLQADRGKMISAAFLGDRSKGTIFYLSGGIKQLPRRLV